MTSMPSPIVRIQTPQCWKCGQHSFIEVPLSGVIAYGSGAFVQDAFPGLSVGDREMVLTGIHPACWDEMFPPEGEL